MGDAIDITGVTAAGLEKMEHDKKTTKAAVGIPKLTRSRTQRSPRAITIGRKLRAVIFWKQQPKSPALNLLHQRRSVQKTLPARSMVLEFNITGEYDILAASELRG
jgi:hypothetical protein